MHWEEMKPYLGRIVGLTFGLVIGIIYLIFGFWKTLMFTIIILLGYYLGKKNDHHQGWTPLVFRKWLYETGVRIKERWAQYRADKARSKWR